MSKLPLALVLCLCPALVLAQEVAPESEPEAPQLEVEPELDPSMTLERLDAIVRVIGTNVETDGTRWRFDLGEAEVLIITDVANNRMRALSPVKRVSEIEEGALLRMMQSNFDSALDARYAIANDIVWSTYIHPLRQLEKNQLISGLGQVVNLAQTYGTLYSGGAMQFGGGDSGSLQRDFIDELLKKGQEI